MLVFCDGRFLKVVLLFTIFHEGTENNRAEIFMLQVLMTCAKHLCVTIEGTKFVGHGSLKAVSHQKQEDVEVQSNSAFELSAKSGLYALQCFSNAIGKIIWLIVEQ